MWYVGKFDEATWNLLALLGMTSSVLKEKGLCLVAVKQEIAYKREVVAGETLTIRSGVIEMREKSVRFFHEMTNNESGEIAAVTILTGVQIDATTRKSRPFEENVLAQGRSLLSEYVPSV
jgi:acyl-CoA thioester hydrolase